MEWNEWIGKKVFVKLRDGSCYTGHVLSVDDPQSPVQFMNMKDKFDEIVCFPIDTIAKINEEKE